MGSVAASRSSRVRTAAGCHLAQVLKTALDATPINTKFPEKKYIRQDELYDAKPPLATVAILAGVSVALWQVLRSVDSA